MRIPIRPHSPLPHAAVGLLALLVPGFLRAADGADPAETPTLREQVEVREVGVVADLPTAWRGRSAADLADRVTVVEGGVERRPTSLTGLGGEGTTPYGRVLVVFDTARCSQDVLTHAADALGAAARELVALGPVEVSLYGSELEPSLVRRLERSLSSSDVAATLARVGREERCGPPPPPERLRQVELDAASLQCGERPCLLVWAGPGWGEPAGEGSAAAPPPGAHELEPLERLLASRGWVVLAAPIASVRSSEPRKSIEEPQSRPGSDQYTFGVNLLGRRKADKPLTAEEYSQYLDLWQAPLRELVAATAGELVAKSDRLAEALASLGRRSILWYRTDRQPAAEAPRLEVHETGKPGQTYRAAAWAPLP